MPFKGRRLFSSLTDIARATVFPTDLASSKRSFIVIYAIRLFFLVGRRLWSDSCVRQAAALSYQTVLSLVPMVAIVVAVASTFDLTEYLDKLVAYLNAHLLPQAASQAVVEIKQMASSVEPQTLGMVGGVTLVFLSMTLFLNVEQVVNEIFRCTNKPRLIVRAVTSILLLLLAPFAFGLSIYLSTRLLFWPQVASAVTPFLLSCLTLFLSYWLLPHTKVSLRRSAISAFVAGLFLECVKYGFAIYATYLGGTLSYIYGTLAILPLFMVWIFCTWIIFLFGAELSAALHEVDHHERFGLTP